MLRILTAMDVPKPTRYNHDTPERDLALNKTRMKPTQALSGTLRGSSPHQSQLSYQFAAGVHYYSPVRWTRHLTSIQRYGNLLTGQQRLWLSFFKVRTPAGFPVSPAQLPDPDRLQSVFRVPEPLAEQPGHTPACPRRGWKVDSRPCPEPVLSDHETGRR